MERGLKSGEQNHLTKNFFGGTIRGIVEKLDYLKTLGVEYRVEYIYNH